MADFTRGPSDMGVTHLKLHGSFKDTGPMIYCFKCQAMAPAAGSIEMRPGKVFCFNHWHERQRTVQSVDGNCYGRNKRRTK